MVRIAVFTYYGLDKGGTEKFLQTVSALLPKDKYIVDYYYIDSDSERISAVKRDFLISNKVNLYPYHCSRVITKKRYVYAANNSFFDVFCGADLILTGSSGFTEEILEQIKDIPIVQTIHYVDDGDNQYNISRVLHISEFSKNMWIAKGGDKSRVLMISHPIVIPRYHKIDIRNKLGISKNDFVFGLHQRENDYIYSDIPLNAYSKIENERTAFVLCGGSRKYREQAKKLGLKKVYFIDSTDSNDIIYSFLESIDVYAHGRFDGELNSTAIAEAMYFGLPIITHPSNVFNGQLEVIDGNGFVASDADEYADKMQLLFENKEIYKSCSSASKVMFSKKYDPDKQIKNIMDIFDEVIENPYPNKFRRKYLSLINSFYVCIKRIAAQF